MSDVLPVRIRRGRRKHALPQAGPGSGRTLCGRPAEGVVIDDGFPDCKKCLRQIAWLLATVVE